MRQSAAGRYVRARTALRTIDRQSTYIWTLAVELFLVVAALATLKLAATAFGTTGFGEFTVARRAVSVIAVPLLLGTGVALTRYVAYARTQARTYLAGAIAVVAPSVIVFTAAAIAFADGVAVLLFGTVGLVPLVTPTLIAIVGLALHAVAYSYFTGHLRMGVANGLQAVNSGAAPLIAVAFSGGSASTALVLLGIVPLVVSAVALFPSVAGAIAAPQQRRDILPSASQLLVYGVPRVPGDVAHFGLFSIPALIVAHRAGIEAAGFLSFGLSLVHLIDAPFAVGRTLLLPTVGRLASGGKGGEIERLVRRTFVASLIVAVLAVVAAEIALDPIIHVLLGPSFSAAAEASRWLLLGAVPYGVYSVLRGPLDALAVWPHISVALATALGVALLLILPDVLPAEVAIPIAFTVLAALTLRALRRSIRTARPSAPDAPSALAFRE